MKILKIMKNITTPYNNLVGLYAMPGYILFLTAKQGYPLNPMSRLPVVSAAASITTPQGSGRRCNTGIVKTFFNFSNCCLC